MSGFVVDTNVLVVASQRSPQADLKCVLASIEALKKARNSIVCIDDRMRILKEYMGNLSMSGQPGLGDAFMKWLWENQAVAARCERVPINSSKDDATNFDEFPADNALVGFDPSDRKFVAVALASRNSPVVVNAVDKDWWNFRDALNQNGIRIEFLCDKQFQE